MGEGVPVTCASIDACWPELLALAADARRLRAHAQSAAGGNPDDGDSDGRRTLCCALDALARRAASPLVGAVYAPLIAGIARGPLTIAQIGQSLDGRIATASGHSRYINGAASLDHLHRLRALADCVVIGAGTVEADDPRLTTWRVAGPNPVRVVIDPRGRLPRGRRVFDAEAPTLSIVARAPAAGRGDDDRTTIAIASESTHLPPAAILDALRGRGLQTVLIEGGGRTISAFLVAGLLDRLHVMVAPLVIGSGPPGLHLPAVARIDDALRLRAGVHRLEDDVLFDCEIVSAPR